MNPIQSLLIDGRPDMLQSLAVPEMSLSSSRVGMVSHSFEFDINANIIAELFEPLYEAWIEESKKDDEICGEPQDDLANAGYPSFSTVLRTPELAELVLGHYLLNSLGRLAWNGIVPIKYWLDRVTHCEIAGNQIKLHGTCYSRPFMQPQK